MSLTIFLNAVLRGQPASDRRILLPCCHNGPCHLPLSNQALAQEACLQPLQGILLYPFCWQAACPDVAKGTSRAASLPSLASIHPSFRALPCYLYTSRRPEEWLLRLPSRSLYPACPAVPV